MPARTERSTRAAPTATANVTLDGSGSADPDGTIVSYVWSQNGTVLATGVNRA